MGAGGMKGRRKRSAPFPTRPRYFPHPRPHPHPHPHPPSPSGPHAIDPPGRLLNRFTKDTEALDVAVSGAVNSALSTFVTAVLSVVVVVVVTPLAVVCFVPLFFVYYRVQQLYIASSRELKRLDSLAFSPIFQHFGESLSGLVTIRAFRKMDEFMDKNRVGLGSQYESSA
jgi:ABC-type multidrug transport system fused ATPase/permease subunit